MPPVTGTAAILPDLPLAASYSPDLPFVTALHGIMWCASTIFGRWARRVRIFTVLSCLSESQIDRESEKHSFYEKILVLRKWA